MTQSPAEIVTILDLVSKAAIGRWGRDLVSVVLFGSFARGDAGQHSDVDLLLIAENLPQDWRARTAAELALERVGLQVGRPIQVILVAPEDVRFAVNEVAPLLLEIRTDYHCLLDQEGFFRNEMKRLDESLVVRGVRKLAEHKWEVPELARQ